jgi:hypothetical protein
MQTHKAGCNRDNAEGDPLVPKAPSDTAFRAYTLLICLDTRRSQDKIVPFGRTHPSFSLLFD